MLAEASRVLESVACDLCGAMQEVAVYSKVEADGAYRIVRCSGCGLVYVNPRSFAEEHDGYFRGPYLATIEENGKKLAVRSQCLGTCGKVFQAVGVAIPPTIREL